jgi:hypothetical protein
MNEYEAIAVYAGFALIVFAIAMVWQHYRESIKKRFHLVNYRSHDDDPKIHHTV